MVITHAMLMDRLKDYKNPKAKLGRLVKSGEYTPVIRGLYETDPDTPAYLLAGTIYGPSYISFDFALAYHGMIPESVHTVTSATFGKNRSRSYDTPFGFFTYRDVPARVYPMGIKILEEGEYAFQIASKEKCICDKLYTMRPVRNQSEMYELLNADLRIDSDALDDLNIDDIGLLSEAYHSTNVEMFYKLLRRAQK